MSTTTYYNLQLTAAEETSPTFLQWRTLMNGVGNGSNMELIDAALHSLDQKSYAKADTYTKAEVNNLIGDLQYEAIEIGSFNVSPSQAEIGSSVSVATLTWTLSKAPEEMSVDGTALADMTMRSMSLSGLSITANKTWTLTATDAGSASHAASTATKTASLTFLNRIYYGAAAIPETLNSAFLLGLSGKDLASSRAKTVTVNAGTGQHIWYAVPVRLGACLFNVGGFDGGFQLAGTISHTNASGYTESYYVYRSDNAALGSTTVKVS